jgi:hypothetical protein
MAGVGLLKKGCKNMGWLLFLGIVIGSIVIAVKIGRKVARESIIDEAKKIRASSKSVFAKEMADKAIFSANQSAKKYADTSYWIRNAKYYLSEATRVDQLTHNIADKRILLEIDGQAHEKEKRRIDKVNENYRRANAGSQSWLTSTDEGRHLLTKAEDAWRAGLGDK